MPVKVITEAGEQGSFKTYGAAERWARGNLKDTPYVLEVVGKTCCG